MSDTKFTEGKWTVEDDIVSVNASGTIALAPKMRTNKENWEANAHLIAAAPDMYKALEDLVRGAEMDTEQIDSEWGSCRTIEQIEADGDLSEGIINARIALAKARGEQ